MSTATKGNKTPKGATNRVDATPKKHKKRTQHSMRKKQAKGYELDMFKDQTKAQQYACKLCKKVARSPCELSCGESDDDDHEVLYCESCISSYLTLNSHQCPLNSQHGNAGYNQTRIVRKQINGLRVYCPNNQHRSSCCGEAPEGKKQENSSNDENEDNHHNNDDSPCNENGCHWSGKLQKLSAHLKACKHNNKYCKICDAVCIEENLLQHNNANIAKHVSLLYDQIAALSNKGNNNNNNNNNLDTASPTAAISSDAVSKYADQMSSLMAEHATLKNEVTTMKAKRTEWTVAFNIESSKKAYEHKCEQDKLYKLIEQQSQEIESLNKQQQELVSLCDELREMCSVPKRQQILIPPGSRSPSPFGLDLNLTQLDEDDCETESLGTEEDDEKKQQDEPTAVQDSNTKTSTPKQNESANQPSLDSENENENTSGLGDGDGDENVEEEREGTPQAMVKLNQRAKSKSGTPRAKARKKQMTLPALNRATKSTPVPGLNFLSKPPPLKRTASMKFFHPELPEPYHPKKIKYEMHHPKKAEEVWVRKTKGSVSKLERYPCCGSAKDGALYLVLAKRDKHSKKPDEPVYVVQKTNLPKSWNKEIHLGCKPNKKKNKKNMSFYLCCEADIFNPGCEKRYKCCHVDVKSKGAREGCKVGWGC